MKKTLMQIVNFGIRPGMPPDIAEQTRLLNGISFMGVPVCMMYVVMFSVTGYYPMSLVFAAAILIFILPLFISKWFGLKISRFFLVTFAGLVFAAASVVSGKDTGFYLGYIVVIVPPILISPNNRVAVVYIIYTLMMMTGSIIGNVYIQPVCVIPWAMGIYLFNLFIVMFTTLTVVFIFKIELGESRDKLAEKNKDIMDSIKYAKRIQKALMPSDKYFEKHFNNRKKDN
jgi:sigma-B regulation protein RsbU (phosphoserine phosphatase)